jgi:hypothetical protein
MVGNPNMNHLVNKFSLSVCLLLSIVKKNMALKLKFLNAMIYKNFSLKKDLVSKEISSNTSVYCQKVPSIMNCDYSKIKLV